MKTIWKYELPIQDEVELDVPRGYIPLTAQNQDEHLRLWLLVEPGAPLIKARFRIIGTGHPIGDAGSLDFIASAQFRAGELVFHVFRVLA